jgi:hypothetical protein
VAGQLNTSIRITERAASAKRSAAVEVGMNRYQLDIDGSRGWRSSSSTQSVGRRSKQPNTPRCGRSGIKSRTSGSAATGGTSGIRV